MQLRQSAGIVSEFGVNRANPHGFARLAFSQFFSLPLDPAKFTRS
jgi:hypothetical protein